MTQLGHDLPLPDRESDVARASPIRPPAKHPRSERAYARFYEGALWPAWERVVRGRSTVHCLAYLERSQWLPRAQIEGNQLAALRALLRYVGEHVPYYRELFAKTRFDPRGVSSTRDLEALPLLTRETVRERYDDLLSEEYVGRSFKKGTSGSTGAPLKFEFSIESECWRQATRIRGYSWAGVRPGLPTFYYWASVATSRTQGLKIQLDRALRRETFVDSMTQDQLSREQALDLIRRTKPRVIICYTQSCAQLARWILDRGARDWDDIAVVCGAEAVLPADRGALSAAFGPVFETYGSRETMLMAAECEAHDGMHLSEENLVLEITSKGKAVVDGKVGSVAVTDLHNRRMPFIRDDNGDLATAHVGMKRCACGRGLRKIARVDGRRADTLVDRNGTAIPGIVFHVLFSDARKELVRQFQAVQKSSGEVVLKVVRGRDWSEEGFAQIHRRLEGYLRGLPLTLEFHAAIAPSANGKTKTIVREQ